MGAVEAIALIKERFDLACQTPPAEGSDLAARYVPAPVLLCMGLFS
jgi:hypothetical protein